MKEQIDKAEIYNKAAQLAGQGGMFAGNTSEIRKGMLPEEETMLLAFTYIELMYKSGCIPKGCRNDLLRAVNTKIQTLAEELKQYRAFSKRQIEFVKITEAKRTLLAKLLRKNDNESSLLQALELIDLYQFGIAESHIYENLYRRYHDINEK